MAEPAVENILVVNALFTNADVSSSLRFSSLIICSRSSVLCFSINVDHSPSTSSPCNLLMKSSISFILDLSVGDPPNADLILLIISLSVLPDLTYSSTSLRM